MRLAGKKFDKWVYRKENAECEVELRVISERSYRGGPVTRVTFFAYRKTDPAIELRDENPEKLREKVWAELDEHFSIKWEKRIMVRIGGSDSAWGEDGREISLSHKIVTLGTRKDGSKVWSAGDPDKTWNPWIKDGWPEVGPDKRDATTVSIVLDTPENHAALAQLDAAFDALTKHLRSFLAPDRIGRTLREATSRLLPIPKGKS